MAETGRYHLYVSYACPWAHRIIIVRRLKGLEDVIGMTVVDPIRDERGWAFRQADGHTADPINGFQYLSEAYTATDAGYRGRVTVPVLWDKVEKCIVSNADDDLMRTLTREFDAFTQSRLDLYPEGLREEIDEVNEVEVFLCTGSQFGVRPGDLVGALAKKHLEHIGLTDKLCPGNEGIRHIDKVIHAIKNQLM